jgi:hypothetical protein
MLDLSFLATGFRQHVFTRTGEQDDWVYKVPVAFGRVLPFDITRLEAARPPRRIQRLAQRFLISGPHAVRDRLERWSRNGVRQGSGRALFGRVAATSDKLIRFRDRALITYFTQKRRSEFRRMLEVLEYLSARRADHVLLPYQVIPAGQALLRVGEAALPYAGPILLQRKASFFVSDERSLRAYDWRDLIHAQQHLWAHGVALLETGEILGPRSWSSFDGRLRLADTSSLTRDRRAARESLSTAELDARERHIRRRLREESSTFPAEEYFRFIRAEIHQDAFDRLWRSEFRVRDGVPA